MEAQNAEDILMSKGKAAVEAIKDYDQKRIDCLVRAIGKAVYDNAQILAEIAVNETGYGKLESKVVKNRRTSMAAWSFLKDKKSTGVIEEDLEKNLVTIAKPAGVVACITPTTNPTATIVVNCMHVLKGKNAAIVSPHPKSKVASIETVNLLRNAIAQLGAPADLIQIVEEPSTELTQSIMRNADVVVATGGASMVKAAYSSGKPSFGVGQGNVQVVIDENFTDYEYIADQTIGNRIYDNGMPCTGEQAVFVPEKHKAEIIAAFENNGAYHISDKSDVEKFRENVFNEKGIIRKELFGQPAHVVGEVVGVEVPRSAGLLLVEVEKFAEEEILSKEILCPIVKLYTYEKFEDAVAGAKKNLLMEGAGHSAVIYSNDDDRVNYFAEEIPVCRIDVNVSAVAGSGSPYNSGMEPTMSNGCGFWGNNSISGPLTYRHLLNYTNVIREIPDVVPPTPEEVWEM